MRLNLITLCAMAVTALASAAFFVRVVDAPVHQQGSLLGKYAAGLRTAEAVDRQPAASSSKPEEITIINAAPQ